MFSAIVNSKQLFWNVCINYFQAMQMFALQKLDPKYYLSVRQDNNFLSWDLNTSLQNTQLSIRVEIIQLLASTYKARMNCWGVNTGETVNWLHGIGGWRKKKQRASEKLLLENYCVGMTVLKQDRYHIIQLSARDEWCRGSCDRCYLKVLVNLSDARKRKLVARGDNRRGKWR